MGYDLEDKLAEIAERFPSLRTKPHTGCAGMGRYDAAKLDEWAHENWNTLCSSSGAREAVRFILSLWSETHEWKCGRFRLRLAWGAWDSEHRAAWQAWATDPWWA